MCAKIVFVLCLVMLPNIFSRCLGFALRLCRSAVNTMICETTSLLWRQILEATINPVTSLPNTEGAVMDGLAEIIFGPLTPAAPLPPTNRIQPQQSHVNMTAECPPTQHWIPFFRGVEVSAAVAVLYRWCGEWWMAPVTNWLPTTLQISADRLM